MIHAGARPFLAGGLIGAVLCAGNLYMGLKTGVTDSGNITATLLAFAILNGRRKGVHAFELNLSTTVAVIAGNVSLAGSLMGAVPALTRAGQQPEGWQLFAWAVASGTLGVLLAIPLRRRLLVDSPMPFPTGIATAELITTLQKAKEGVKARLRVLAASASAAAAYVWFRDGWPSVLPAEMKVPGTFRGYDASSLTLGVACQPMLLGVGALIGPKAAISLMLGAAMAWVGLGPGLLHAAVVPDASYGSLVAWLVWPGAGVIVGASFTSLVQQRSMALNGVRDLLSAFRRPLAPSGPAEGLSAPTVLALAALSVMVLAFLGHRVFQVGPSTMLLTLALSVLLTGVCARAAGQTDVAPSGAMSQVSQVTLLPFTERAAASLGVAGTTQGLAAQAANSLWCLKTGEVLGAPLRPQLWAQLGAVWLGAAICVPIYLLLVQGNAIGSNQLPAPGAMMSWALAEALTLKGTGLPAHALEAAGIGAGVGAALQALGARRFVPMAFALGVGFVIPASYAVTIFLGAMGAWAISRSAADSSTPTVVATGLISGEAVTGITVACLRVAGVAA